MGPLGSQSGVSELAAKIAAGRPGEAMRGAKALAEACESLARAGWHLNQLRVDAGVARRLNAMFGRAALLPGIFGRRMHEGLPALPVRVCCVGWDAAHWPDVALLDLLAAKAASFEMYVPSPRLPADGLQREWIEALEQRLGVECVTCPESGFASKNEPLVARLENSELAERGEAREPGLLVGHDWQDQVGLVCERVVAWLAENPDPGAPIGLIAPEDSPTAVAVAEALEKAGVRVEHAGRIREPAAALLIIEQVARYHLGGHDVAELLELARLLWVHARESWQALEPEAVRNALDKAFQAAQSRNGRILAKALPWRSDPVWGAVREVVEALGRWDGEALPWPALREKWEVSLAALHLSPEALPAAPAQEIFDPERISGQAFMEWVADEVAAERRLVAQPDYGRLAPVVVTTFANAAQQTWGRLIFLDSNERVWPAPIAENRFLPDAARIRLNANRNESGRLLTTQDLRLLDQARFLDLIEHCSGSVAFAGVLLDDSGEARYAQPNEWVIRTLLETSDEVFPTELWTARACECPAAPALALEPAERAHLEMVHSARRNGTMPLDRYQFNYHESKLEPGPWSAGKLDQAVTCPATFALRELFGAESTADWEPARAETQTVGNRAHRWLERILALSNRLSPPSPAREDEMKLARELAAARRELEEWFGAEGLPMPMWWVTCLRKTEWATRRCLREVRGLIEGGWCAMEQNMTVAVQTPSGPLPLKGRIDIMICDRPEIRGAAVRMFDFKTGRSDAPTLSTLEKGSGAQFAAYYLMARDAGAAEAEIGIIKPEDRAHVVFGTDDEGSLRARFAVLAELRRTLRFGRRGPLVTERGVCETLPLATTPIDPAILEQKAGLFLLAS
jgi:hypothetical protein